MNVIDRVESARHTLTGSGLSKAISKATSHEVIGPKKKHVDYIQGSLESGNVSLPDTADMLFERCTNSSWVVVFKALVTCHHLMSNANERFIQYVASKSSTWMLHNFLDKGGVQGYDMSHIIRKYSAYLSEKAYSYRSMGFDFCRATRGKENGVLRNMESTKLLKALPAIQQLLDSLIACNIASNELTNGVVTAAFMLLFKDLIRLFACYNDGIINLLEVYFEMKKNDCKTALEIYRKFVARMERVSEFLKVAEDVGIDKGDIPDLTKAPNSLLNALESHYQSLEKGKSVAPPSKPMTLPTFDVSHSSSYMSQTPQPSTTSPEPSNDFLKEQQRMLEMFEKKKREESIKQSQPPQQIPAPLNPPQQTLKTTAQSYQPQPQQEQLTATEDLYAKPKKPSSNKPSDDLLLLNTAPSSNPSNLFAGSSTMSPPTMFPQQPFAQPYSQQYNGNAFNQNFNANFQTNQSKSTPNLMDDDLLAPERATPDFFSNSTTTNNNQNAQVNGDLNKGLERVAMSLDGLNINPSLQKAITTKGHNWGPPQSNIKTGGANYQMQTVARTTLPPSGYGMPPNMAMGPMNPMYQNQYRAPMQPFGMQQPNYGAPGYPMMQPRMVGGVYGGGMNPAMGGFAQPSMSSTNSSNFMNDPFK